VSGQGGGCGECVWVHWYTSRLKTASRHACGSPPALTFTAVIPADHLEVAQVHVKFPRAIPALLRGISDNMGGVSGMLGRALHSSTSQLNLSRS